MDRLAHHQEIYNTLSSLGLKLYYSKSVMNHLVHIIDGMLTKGCSGTLTDLHQLSYHPKHRTTLSHFLHKGVWDENRLLQAAQQSVCKQIHRLAKQTNEPVFLMIDDTICQKTKPSLQAKSPIEGCDHHFSHTEGKFVWGHQVVWMMIRCAHRAFPYAFARYDKTSGISKIALARQMIQSLHGWNHRVYVLFDSWYTSKSLIETCLTKGWYVIAALKTNRILYPQGIRQSAKEFARYIDVSDTHLVTVGGETYRVYRYEGALNDIPNAVVLFCWKTDQPMTSEHLRCFLSTDTKTERLGYSWILCETLVDRKLLSANERNIRFRSISNPT